jgi:hypothetical protein
VNRGSSGANATILWNEPAKSWQILDVANSNYYTILTTENIVNNVLITSSNGVASANVANALYGLAQAAYNQANTAASASSYANTGITLAQAAYNAGNSTATVANTAINNAASASLYANTGINNAASASLYANTGINNAASASLYANTAINNAASASLYANNGINNAASASLYANTAINNAASASLYANTAINNAVIQQNQINNLNGSLAVQLALLAPKDSPVLTGHPVAPTPAAGDNSTTLATTAFVEGEIASARATWQGSKYTVSTQPPSGGNTGDFWFQTGYP